MITIIYPYRNKEIDRVENSLRSLEQQTNKEFKVLIVDYGSETCYKDKLKQLGSEFKFVDIIYSHTKGQLWSRSIALNIGLKACKTEYVFISDVDMLFNNSFTELLHRQAAAKTLTYYKVAYLEESESYHTLEFDTYKISSYSKDYAMGMCLFSLQDAIDINGYDEFFKIWGGEDNDFINRMKNAGVSVEFNQDETYLYHQYHLPHALSKSLTPTVYLDDFDAVNKLKYAYNSKTFYTVNNEGWGEIQSDINYEKRTKISNVTELPLDKNSVNIFVNYYLKNTVMPTRFEFKAKTKFTKKQRLRELWRKITFKENKRYTLYEVNQILLKSIVFDLSQKYNYIYKIEENKIVLTLQKK